MGIFQDVGLAWKGEEFTIPASRVLGAISIVEEQITFPELIAAMQSGRPPLSTIAKAYGGVLRYAGAKVSDDEAYSGMFDSAAQQAIITAVNTLLVMMVPPGALANQGVAAEASASGNAGAAASKSSRRSSKRRSAAAG